MLPIKPDVHSVLRRAAKADGTTITQLGDEILRKALGMIKARGK